MNYAQYVTHFVHIQSVEWIILRGEECAYETSDCPLNTHGVKIIISVK